MKSRIGSRIRPGFFAMAALLFLFALAAIVFTYHLQSSMSRNIANLRVAQELEVSLFRLRGLVANYLLDGDARWLERLEERKGEFHAALETAAGLARTPVD